MGIASSMSREQVVLRLPRLSETYGRSGTFVGSLQSPELRGLYAELADDVLTALAEALNSKQEPPVERRRPLDEVCLRALRSVQATLLRAPMPISTRLQQDRSQLVGLLTAARTVGDVVTRKTEAGAVRKTNKSR